MKNYQVRVTKIIEGTVIITAPNAKIAELYLETEYENSGEIDNVDWDDAYTNDMAVGCGFETEEESEHSVDYQWLIDHYQLSNEQVSESILQLVKEKENQMVL